jgi:tRNA(adenine34) deaminase
MNTIDFIQDSYRDDLSMRAGVLAQQCAALYIPPDADISEEEQFN